MRRLAAIALCLLYLCACGGAGGVGQYLDSETAATISVARQPWIFARERPEIAVNVRDYVSLHPVEINRTGERRIYLLAHAWSTIDRSELPPAGVVLAIAADDRLVTLRPVDASPRSLGAGEPPVASSRGSRQWWLPIDPEALAYIAASQRVSVQLHGEAAPLHYESWRDARAVWRTFLQQLPRTE